MAAVTERTPVVPEEHRAPRSQSLLGKYILSTDHKQVGINYMVTSFMFLLIGGLFAILMNNLLLVGIAFAVFWGTIFPLLSEAARGPAGRVTVGAPFYNRVTGPLFLLLLLVMAAGPLLPWRKASAENLRRNLLRPLAAGAGIGAIAYVLTARLSAALAFGVCAAVVVTVALEFYRGTRAKRCAMGYPWLHALVHLVDGNHARYGGYLVHLGIALVALGVAGSTILKVDAQGAVRLGQSLAVGDYRATPVRRQPGVVPGVGPSWTATVEVAKDGRPVATLTPRLVVFQQNPFQGAQPIGVAALHSTPRQDIYVTLVEPSRDLRSVRLHVLINPLLWWIWVGGAIVLLGGLVCVHGGRARAPGQPENPRCRHSRRT